MTSRQSDPERLREALREIAFAASYGVAIEGGELGGSALLGRIARVAEDTLDALSAAGEA